MKTEVTPGSSRYRNDAVFRSAERLLASTSRKPARPAPPRSVIFVAGLLCGVGIAFWALRPATKNAPDAANPDAPTAVQPPASTPPPSPRRGAEATAPTHVPTPAAATLAAPEQATQPVAPDAPVAGDVRSIAPITSSHGAALEPATAPLNIVTRSSVAITLRGHLHTASGEMTAVEFALNLSPIGSNQPVYGLVRFRDRPERPDERHVSGTWNDRTLTLQQSAAPTTTGLRPYGQRTFILEFPPSNIPITGRWSHQTPIGKTEGTLTLTVSLLL